ncbi:MAG TPA: zinc-binding dehydrogenase [Planctomycetota bacterium]|nr:zinc-binding dehydrogenase [Planctomycetota bacterium]
MKAVYFDAHGELDVLRYGDVPEPVAGPGEVVLRMRAAALNFNDIWARKGLPRVRIPLPHVSGTDGAGVVVDVGPDVEWPRTGDEVLTYPVNACRACRACLAGEEVFCRRMRIWGFQTGPYDGSYAQYAKVQAAQCRPKPAHLSWAEAAATSTSLLSVWRMLVTRAKVQAGERVLVWGASGGTGTFALLLGRQLGAELIAVTSSDDKEAWCLEQGADHVVRSDRDDVERRVRELTDGVGVDVVFDHVGETVWPISIECLRWGGRLVICGATEGFEPRIDLRYLWNKQLSFLGSHIGTHREWVDCLRLVEQRRIEIPVTETYALADLAEAQRAMEGRRIRGKLAIDCE